MLYTDYEWFEAYEDTIDRYFVEDENLFDLDEFFVNDDEGKLDEIPWVED